MVSLRKRFCVVQIAVMDVCAFLKRGFLMIVPMKMNRIAFAAFALLTSTWPVIVHAQDVPGIEICTVEKTMERRTSCLQSNVDFLQKTINKLTSDHQQKLDAANRQIEALKGAVIGMQKIVVEMQAAQKAADDAKKAATPAAKDAPPATRDAAPTKEGAK
jgi:TolA-binding protein